MKKKINYFNYEERNGVFLLIFILLLFCIFIFLQKRVLPNESNITLVYATMGETVNGKTDSGKTEMKSSFQRSQSKAKSQVTKSIPKSHKSLFATKIDSIKSKEDKAYSKQEFSTNKAQNYNYEKPKSSRSFGNKKKYKKREPVKSFSINSTDPLDWEQIYGIGPGYAKRIIKYQNWLGGFHSKEQIKEVYGITDSFYNAFKDHILPSEPYRKLSINSVEEKQIGKHPYVSWKEAKNIIRYRNHHFPIKETDFEKIRGISDSTRMKILPYLDFEYKVQEMEIDQDQKSISIDSIQLVGKG